MLNILVKTRHCASTDPRDKVYALLPLLPKADRNLKLTPNYGLSLAVVFIDTAIYPIEHWGIEVLCRVQGQSELVSMPSWIPDWSICLSEKLGLRQTQLPFVQSFRAGGDFNPDERPVTQLWTRIRSVQKPCSSGHAVSD